jgi:hypothetical protein
MTDPHSAKPPKAAGNSLRLDIVAGLVAAAVVLPKAMAYATVAGLPVAVGLYTAFIPMLVYALAGLGGVMWGLYQQMVLPFRLVLRKEISSPKSMAIRFLQDLK